MNHGADTCQDPMDEASSMDNDLNVLTSRVRIPPEAKELVRMAGKQKETFLEDIKVNKIEVAIDVFEGEEVNGHKVYVIKDGIERYLAALDAGMQEVPVRIVPNPGENLLKEMIRAACLRRHLTEGQLAMLVAKLAKVMTDASKSEKATKAARARHGSNSNDSVRVVVPASENPGRIRETLANEYRIPVNKLRLAQEVMRTSPELAAEVSEGEKTLGEASREIRNQKGETKSSFRTNAVKSLVNEGDDVVAETLFEALGSTRTATVARAMLSLADQVDSVTKE